MPLSKSSRILCRINCFDRCIVFHPKWPMRCWNPPKLHISHTFSSKLATAQQTPPWSLSTPTKISWENRCFEERVTSCHSTTRRSTAGKDGTTCRQGGRCWLSENVDFLWCDFVVGDGVSWSFPSFFFAKSWKVLWRHEIFETVERMVFFEVRLTPHLNRALDCWGRQDDILSDRLRRKAGCFWWLWWDQNANKISFRYMYYMGDL